MNYYYSTLTILVALIAISENANVLAASTPYSTYTIGKNDLLREQIAVNGDLVTARMVEDHTGTHILLLTSIGSASRERPSHRRTERVDLRASYYRKVNNLANIGTWTEDWNIKDAVDCPGLDSSASFFASHVTVTDLNKDGVAEITVPYKMFCGGGIDSATIKIIMRQGSEKYALRGDSLVRILGQRGFGGSYQTDTTLSLLRNTAYREHLLKVWKQVYVHGDSWY
jgi:hypothetical protein